MIGATYRGLFPAVEASTYLNSAAESPLNSRSRLRLDEYLDIAAQQPFAKPSVRTPLRRQLASLFGGDALDYALVTSTGVGLSLTAAGLNWRRGDNVVVPEGEHWNNTFPWLALAERGVEVRRVPLRADFRLHTEDVLSRMDRQTRVLAVAAVRFNSGLRLNLKELSAVANQFGALFVVDGIQAAGAVPLNVVEDGIDILCCGGFKWLLGMPGTGFAYFSEKARQAVKPVMPGMFAAEDNMKELLLHDDARRYETGSIAYSLFYGWSAGLSILQEAGIIGIHASIMSLTDRLIAGLHETGMLLMCPVDTVSERSGIVVFSAGSETANTNLFERLQQAGVVVTLRGGGIRVSPSFYNTGADIDRFLNAL